MCLASSKLARHREVMAIEFMCRMSCLRNTLLVVHLILVLILVISIVTSVMLHGINPTLFLLTIFDLNSVLRLSETMHNTSNTTTTAYIAINSPSAQFLFASLTLYITAIFNQMISIVAILRHHLCILVFNLLVNLVILCLAINFIKTNLFLLLTTLILLSVAYAITLKQMKSHQVHEVGGNHNNNNIAAHTSIPSIRQPENYAIVQHQPMITEQQQQQQQAQQQQTQQQLYQLGNTATTPSTPNEPKILAPIIYCPHYTESVC